MIDKSADRGVKATLDELLAVHQRIAAAVERIADAQGGVELLAALGGLPAAPEPAQSVPITAAGAAVTLPDGSVMELPDGATVRLTLRADEGDGS